MNMSVGLQSLSTLLPLRRVIDAVGAKFTNPANVDAQSFIRELHDCREIRFWRREDTYWNVLGRLPESPDFFGEYERHDDRVFHIWSCIISDEMRGQLPERVCTLYPTGRRILFLHIPRTGGTAVREHIEKNIVGVTWNFHNEEIEDIDEFPHWNYHGLRYEDYIARLMVQLSAAHGKPFIMTGHAFSQHIFRRKLISPLDMCFTTVREPMELVQSLLRHLIGSARHNAHRTDGADWRAWIAALDPYWRPGDQPSPTLLGRILRSDLFVQNYANPITRAFSLAGDLDSARRQLRIFRYRVFDIRDPQGVRAYINHALAIRGPIEVRNRSERFDLPIADDDLAFIETNLISRDRQLYCELSMLQGNSNNGAFLIG